MKRFFKKIICTVMSTFAGFSYYHTDVKAYTVEDIIFAAKTFRPADKTAPDYNELRRIIDKKCTNLPDVDLAKVQFWIPYLIYVYEYYFYVLLQEIKIYTRMPFPAAGGVSKDQLVMLKYNRLSSYKGRVYDLLSECVSREVLHDLEKSTTLFSRHNLAPAWSKGDGSFDQYHLMFGQKYLKDIFDLLVRGISSILID